MRSSSLLSAIALAVGIAGAGAFASPAMADDDGPGRYPTRDMLTVAEIHQRLVADGFTRIEEIEFDDGRYEVEAIDRRGREVELELDPRSGRILKKEFDD